MLFIKNYVQKNYEFYSSFPPKNVLQKNFKHTKNLYEFYSDHLYTCHLDSTINIFLYLLYHVSILQSPIPLTVVF